MRRERTCAWPDVRAELAARIEAPGFELLGAVNVGAYNETLDAALDGHRLPELEPCSAQSLVLVIGNTRRLWPSFLDAYRTTALAREAQPLDAYTRWHLEEAAGAVARAFELSFALRFTFDPVPRAVAIQRLVTLAGVAEPSPVGLCVHPEYGPWFSLRAAAIFGVPGPAPSSPPATCSQCTTRPCLVRRDELITATGGEYSARTFEAHWPLWLAMREACPVGRDARYSEQQVRYHYLKQLETLRAPAV
jgi:cyanocobalamin reductase (cyanide-eliminating) / alkylcobalamin dealkylase